ncbi:MAG TPA: GH25 family lysozyme, partial [Candidatus Binatus sp.]|nr:GH25 family lysozyme [Candidatus Binatus sp.]
MLHWHRSALPRGLGLAIALGIALSIAPLAAGGANASTSTLVSNCAANLRTRPSTSATIRRIIATNTTVTVAGKVSGSWWSASCGRSLSGSSWYAISAIAGRSVSSLYGVSVLYGATGLFRSAGYSYGIDVSAWQGSINFVKVRASGRTFVIAKATEGNT